MVAYRGCAKRADNGTLVPIDPEQAQEVDDRCAGSAELPLRGFKNYEIAQVLFEDRLHSLENEQFGTFNIDFHQPHFAQMVVLMIIVKASSRNLVGVSMRWRSSDDAEGSIISLDDPKQLSRP